MKLPRATQMQIAPRPDFAPRETGTADSAGFGVGTKAPCFIPASFSCRKGGKPRRPIGLFARSAAWLLPFLLTACFHKAAQVQTKPVAPPLADVNRPSPESVVLSPAANAIPAPDLPQFKPAPPRKPVKRSKPASPPTQQASNGSPGVSAIGQLSSGSPYDVRSQTSDSIAATELKLNAINRKLGGQEQKTAAQIGEFLKQARAALASGDVDGARTLVAKAKVLLGELAR